MKKIFLILALFPLLLFSQQYTAGVPISKKIFWVDIRSGEEQAAFKVDYTINPDMKALPVKSDEAGDEIKEGTDYILTKGENGKYTFVLTDSQGKEHKVESDVMPATIEDKEGNTYEVNEKGRGEACFQSFGNQAG